MLIGFGLTILIRNNASIGGITITAVFLERKININAAKTTLCTDIAIVLLGLIFFDLMTVIYSLGAFTAVSSVLGHYRQPKLASIPTVLAPTITIPRI